MEVIPSNIFTQMPLHVFFFTSLSIAKEAPTPSKTVIESWKTDFFWGGEDAIPLTSKFLIFNLVSDLEVHNPNLPSNLSSCRCLDGPPSKQLLRRPLEDSMIPFDPSWNSESFPRHWGLCPWSH